MTGEHHTQDARLKDIRTIRYVPGQPYRRKRVMAEWLALLYRGAE